MKQYEYIIIGGVDDGPWPVASGIRKNDQRAHRHVFR